MARAKNELLRVPGAAIPGVLAPTIFFLGLNGVFGALTQLKGFTTGSYESFIVPISMLQGAGFTGAAAGVNLARDIEQGWLDRLLVSPAPRWVLLAGTVLAASARSLIPATFVLTIALVLGAGWPGIDGLLVTYFMVAAMAAVAACWGSMLALHFKSQSAAPLMQAGMMALILTTTAYAPLALLQGWLAGHRPRQPGHPGGRSGAAGLRRRSHLGRNLARPARPRGPAGRPRRPRAARDAPHRRVTDPPQSAAKIAERVLRQNWLRGRARRDPVRLHPAQPRALPVAVVLGLVLRGDRLAALRARARPRRAGEPARRPARRTASSATRSSGIAPSRSAGCPSTTSPRAARSRPRRSSRRCSPGPGSIAVGDPAAEPRIVAQADWLAAPPRPRRRRAALDRAAGRVRARRLAQVRPGLGPARERADRLPAPGAAQPAARLRRPPDPRPRRPGALRDRGQHALVALAAGAGPPLGDPGAGRSALGRAPRPLPRRGAAGRRPAGRPHLGGARPARPARPAGGDRPPPGRGAPAQRRASSSPRSRHRRSPSASRATNPMAATARSAATGAARPGSTPPGCSGSACAGSATTRRRNGWQTA